MVKVAKVLIILSSLIYVACDNDERVMNLKGTSIPATVPNPEATPPNVENDILTDHFGTAEAALARAIIDKNLPVIQQGLLSRFTRIRIRAATTLGELRRLSSTQALIQALQENQGIIGGGTEIQIEQNQLTRAIVSALEKITKLRFQVSKRFVASSSMGYDPLSSDEMEEIITKTDRWCASRKCS